jgi:nitroreductase
MSWNENTFKAMATLASRSPSVHNVQPWKIRYTNTGFDLYQSFNRRLHVGDPRLHDNDVSLGCFLELCSIFLKKEGYTFSLTKLEGNKIQTKNDVYEPRFKITLNETPAEKDPLYDFIEKRKSYRGIFPAIPLDEESLKKIQIPGLDIKWITGKEKMKQWSAIYDESSSHINKIPGYFKELIHWLRFSEKHSEFNNDGLNYKALALGKPEAILGSWLFKEAVFNFLARLGMEKALITEAPQIKSAQGIFVIFASQKLNSIEMGRAFMRFWLTLESLGISVCPLSALVDFTGSLNILNTLKTDDATICLNVLRFGKVADEKIIYPSPRLGIERFIIS